MSEFTIKGESTKATVHGSEEAFDDYFTEQVSEIVDHEAFENPIHIMPDGHGGAGAVIGFTMEIGDKVVPNTVGVDIGCGMTAVNVGKPGCLEGRDEDVYSMIDDDIRQEIPFGRNTHDDPEYHIVEDFPWERCEKIWEQFSLEWSDAELDSINYGKDYFIELCAKVGYDVNRAIASMGSLGGGNHFVEISRSTKNGEYWVTVHSGSRGIGYSVAEYWQDKATHLTTARKTLDSVPVEQQKYLKDNWKPDSEAIRSDFEGEEIQKKFDEISRIIEEYGPNSDERNTELDWLEGEEALGYFKDMIFAQQYARESRLQMCKAVAEVLLADIQETVDSIHNYVDFEDMTIRKGATRAHEGEKLIIPFNMRDGTILCRGKGNDNWNRSAPHGAGREMSRTQAFNELDFEDFQSDMDNVFSTSVTEETLDESPRAYKDTQYIQNVIEESAEIIDRWEPVMNLKAEE
mgnify:CR=1 FL=1